MCKNIDLIVRYSTIISVVLDTHSREREREEETELSVLQSADSSIIQRKETRINGPIERGLADRKNTENW